MSCGASRTAACGRRRSTRRAGTTVGVDEAQLEATGNERLALKDAAPEPPHDATRSTPRRGGEIRLGLGVSTGKPRVFGSGTYDPDAGTDRDVVERSITGVFSATYAITDRLAWAVPVPAFAYRFGEHGSFEVIPRAGLTAIGYSRMGGLLGTLDGGVATRLWLGREVSFLTNVVTNWDFQSESTTYPRSDFLDLGATGGIVWTIENRVTLALGAGWSGQARLRRAEEPAVPLPTPPPSTSSTFVLGAVQTLGYRPLPLVQIHVSRSFSLDAYASLGIDLRNGDLRDRYLAGFTVSF